MRFKTGHPVRVEFTKWGDQPHWAYDGLYLGEDEHGEWVGHHRGTYSAKPGRAFDARTAFLTLAPRTDAAHLVTFNASDHPEIRIYVDMTTPAEWVGHVLGAIDLDLDVIELVDGTIFIDDEDEFEQHQIEYGYPPEIIAMAEESAERVYQAVSSHQAPYDGTAVRWFEVLAQAQVRAG